MNKTTIFVGVLFAAATNTLMQTLVATISPQIVSDLGGESLYSWIFSIFLLASTITIPFFAKLADAYGYKIFFMIGMTIFLLGSLLCGLAASMPFLIIARLIQGLGVGALGPVLIATVSFLYSLEERGKVMGLFAATQILSNVIGPVIGGVVAQYLGWQWAFYMVIPFGITSMFLIYGFVQPKNESKVSVKQMDVIGAFLLGGSIAFMIQAMTRIGEAGFDSLTMIMFVLSLVFVILFFFQERRHPDPVISPKLIRIKNVQLANMSAFLVGLLMYGSITILPLYATIVFGAGSVNSGKLLIPLMIGSGLGIILGGRVIKNYSYKAIAQSGWLISCTSLIALGWMSLIELFNLWSLVVIFFMGFGIGSLLPTFLLPAQNAVSKKDQAVVGGTVQLSRNIGGAVGIPVLTVLLTLTNGMNHPSGGYWLVFLFLAASAIVGLCVGTQYKGSIREEMKQSTE